MKYHFSAIKIVEIEDYNKNECDKCKMPSSLKKDYCSLGLCAKINESRKY